MTFAAQTLARFAAELRLDTVPEAVQRQASACIADTLACSTFGARFPWSQAVANYARRYGAGGPCTILGTDAGQGGVTAPMAALANGSAAHAFEQDSLRFPGAGVHPGATLVPALLAACQEMGASGEQALTAFIAGCEVLFRIGKASHHSSEKLGFHAPGLTGGYGAAIAAGLIFGLSAEQLAHALGIAGSMSAGLLAFTKAEHGATVKRLHIGRATEAGLVAARLAGEGYEGPETILEGRFGFLETYCRDGEAALLTSGLGSQWETLTICIKRYPCHATAQAPVQALRELMAEHNFSGKDVTGLTLVCNEKILSHHDIREPGDIMNAQYSLPFCVSLALHRDPEDPRSFDESSLSDPDIAHLCKAVVLRSATDLPSAWSARLTLQLKDGRTFEKLAQHFKGLPSHPLSDEDQRRRFLLLTEDHVGSAGASEWYARLSKLAQAPRFPMAAERA